MSYLLSEMTWLEAKEAIAKAKYAIVPVGSQEQHGPHVVESSDTVRAAEFAKLVAERVAPDAVITPTIPVGVSAHHIGLPGTLTLREDTLIRIVEDIATSLERHGIRRVFLLNAHGGNQSALNVATERLRTLGIVAATCNYTTLAKDVISKGVAGPIYGHACERETSELLYMAPDKVRTELLATIATNIKFEHPFLELTNPIRITMPMDFKKISTYGYLGDPSKASAEFGKQIIDRCLEQLVDFLTVFRTL